jgi:hypothetical protein
MLTEIRTAMLKLMGAFLPNLRQCLNMRNERGLVVKFNIVSPSQDATRQQN